MHTQQLWYTSFYDHIKIIFLHLFFSHACGVEEVEKEKRKQKNWIL